MRFGQDEYSRSWVSNSTIRISQCQSQRVVVFFSSNEDPTMKNLSTPDEHQFAAFVGIDWADQAHEVAIAGSSESSQPPQHFELAQTPEAISAWATQLRQEFGGRKIAVCLEQSKGALVYALMKYDHLVLFPVNPTQLKRFRDAIYPSVCKTDPIDAALILEFLQKHRSCLRPWNPDDQTTRLLGQLVADRRSFVDDRTRLMLQLKQCLKEYFPLALEVLGTLDKLVACEFLLRWGCFADLKKATAKEVETLYRNLGSNRADVIKRRLAAIAAAEPLTEDAAIIEASMMKAQTLAKQLLTMRDSIISYDSKIKSLMASHPDAKIFRSFPAAGDAMAPRLLTAFGTNRERFQSASEFQSLTGVAPVTIRSGKSKIVKRRWACNKFLLQSLHEYARLSIGQSVWAKAFYDMKRAQGVKHHTAIRNLAYKWARILFVCWKNRTLYNEMNYIAQLIKRESPIIKYMAQTPEK
jgi:transposase